LLNDGPNGIRGLIEYLRAKTSNAHFEINHIIAAGDLVVLHVQVENGGPDRSRAIADFYRLKDGKIAEHWDFIQDIPENSKNANGMFYGSSKFGRLGCIKVGLTWSPASKLCCEVSKADIAQ
jgi:predicted SnoaL-like aldol condensation-catalyzing enzyme